MVSGVADITQIDQLFQNAPKERSFGVIRSVRGLLVEVRGLIGSSVGDQCLVLGDQDTRAEVVSFDEERTFIMPFSSVDGFFSGQRVVLLPPSSRVLYPHMDWLGRVVNGLGEPVDKKGPLTEGSIAVPIRRQPPPASLRSRLGGKMDVGVRSLNTFVSCCFGQRMGIFAGSGVGKSTLLSMIASKTTADIIVIGLIGERGKEARDFIEDYLGPEGMRRAVVVLSTSDESALLRRQAAYVTLCIAEYFRDMGKNVLCMMDSVTRFALAMREIGLAIGEPPASRGYTPGVFSELPRLLERAGPGLDGSGTVTGLFTVLVDGDDHNEPISDTVRGILDGHIVLDRRIAERNRYPAINILRSVSRMLPGCNNEKENMLIAEARRLMSTYSDMEEMIRLGAYRPGSDQSVDEAITYHEPLERFLSQRKDEVVSLQQGYEQLGEILAPLLESKKTPLNQQPASQE